MKKAIIITSLIILSLTVGCAKNTDTDTPQDTPAPTINADVAKQSTGSEQEMPEYEVLDDELSSSIKAINEDAVVTGSTNPGAKMISIKLPIEKNDSSAKNFLKQISRIMSDTSLNEVKYDYVNFGAISDDDIILSVSFKKTDSGYAADKLIAVDESLDSSLKEEASKNSIFKIAE